MGENKKRCKYCGSLMDKHENVCIHCGTIDNSMLKKEGLPLKIALISSALLLSIGLLAVVILFSFNVNVVW